jgi:hypothetical protein
MPHFPAPVGFARLLMQHVHVGEQVTILLRSATLGATVPRIKPTATDVECLTQARHPELLSMLLKRRTSLEFLGKVRRGFF